MRTEQAIIEFIASRIAANLSPATIGWYKDRLMPLVRSCTTLPRRPEPVEYFLANIQGSKLIIYGTTIFHQHHIVASDAGNGTRVRLYLLESISTEEYLTSWSNAVTIASRDIFTGSSSLDG